MSSPSPDLATSEPEVPQGGAFGPEHRALTIGILVSVGMVAFESMGVATILPVIAGELDGLVAYGWGFSALMLANIVGTVVAGHRADRSGPALPLSVGMAVFAAGCAVAGAADSWPLFLAGRVLQGLGVGAVMALAYVLIGLAYPERVRPRMYAIVSSAWTVPSLAGPFIAGVLADWADWRAVFLLMPPLAALAFLMTVPGLRRRLPSPEGAQSKTLERWWRSPLASALVLTAGTALVLQAFAVGNAFGAAAVAVVGFALAVPALRRVTPAGTLTARSGLGAGVVVRGLLCAVYFGSEAFLPLGLQALRGMSPAASGLGLSAGALTWVAGAALQARWDAKRPNRVRDMRLGFALLLAGVVVIAAAILVDAVPAPLAIAGWAIGGLGIGIGFNAGTSATLGLASADRQGEISSSLQLAQALSTALAAGVGRGVIAVAGHAGAGTHAALLIVFAMTAALALCGVLLARRAAG
jgi:MFS family permease